MRKNHSGNVLINKKSASGAAPKLLLCSILLLALCATSLFWGRYKASAAEVIEALWVFISGQNVFDSASAAAVVNIRLPRILIACIVGANLSVSGCAYQAAFQNPMASPDVLGAASGACFGAALAIYLGAPYMLVSLCAFCFSLLTVTVVYLVGRKIKGDRIVSMILTGMMIGSLCSAGTSYIKLVADTANQLPAITYWLMGSMSGLKLSDAGMLIVPSALCIIIMMMLSWRMNLLSFSDEEAKSMGVNINLLKGICIVCASLLSSISVSVCGLIGWVGLIVPHLSRRIAGEDTGDNLPFSALLGALIMLAADDISRCIFVSEIPIGILTAVIGVPFFLFLMCKGSVKR